LTPKKRPPERPAAAPSRAWRAFARKYRPLRFEEVVGQEAVGRTLRGALREGQIPAAFLFAGPRGVGKTTMARIFAKALNCARADAPTPDPCGTCATCTAIADGSALDVVEVDAASHNGVDDVREIRERVAHLPAGGRYKVYILDEAHMFSTAAWNAFLKTLEEPPPHARFVFATTEPEKVPETILSRCQRFDFRRIAAPDIVRTLRLIVDRENAERTTPIDVNDGALASLARFARGGLRDAESLLEQAVLAGEGTVREEDLAALLGTVPREMVRDSLERAAAGDATGTLEAYARVHAAGGDAATFLGQALEMLREVAAVGIAGPRTSLVDAEASEKEALAALAGAFGVAGALRATQALAETLRLVRATDEERPLVEAGLLRVALGGGARSLPEVLDALAAMEARLGGDAPPGPTAAAPPVGASAAPGDRVPGERTDDASPAAASSGGDRLFRTDLPPGSRADREDGPLDLARVLELWPRIAEEAKGRAASLGTFLPAARPTLVAKDALTLEFPPSMSFHRAQCEAPDRLRALGEAVEAVLGRPLRVLFQEGPAGGSPGPGDAEEEPAGAADLDRLRHREIEEIRRTPVVEALEKEFQVRMVRIGRKDPPAAEPGATLDTGFADRGLADPEGTDPETGKEEDA